MSDEPSAADPVGRLAEEFAERYRKGERPALAEYTDRYPELAERIKQLFPMLVALEQAGSGPATSPDATTPAAAVPAQVGGYRILREIGRGGMGVVYEAEQVTLGRRVALKVLPLQMAQDGSGLERFRREARAAARLHHTNIVPVYEVGEDGGLCYYAMQFIHGQPLDQVLDELRKLRAASHRQQPADNASVAHSLLTGWAGRQPPREAVAVSSSSSVTLPGQTDPSAVGSNRAVYYRCVARVGVQVAEALEHAHKEGVIHRDVKPSNLLLDAEGRVWVADFGLAKTDGSNLTSPGDVVGTVRYMAPERFGG